MILKRLEQSPCRLSGRSFCLFLICLAWLIAQTDKAVAHEKSAANKQRVAPAVAGTKPGWMFETTIKDLGRCRYFVTAAAFRAEYPMFLVYADLKSYTVTIGNWETQKCFSFPMGKARYYLGLMGFSVQSRKSSIFSRQFPQTPWKKVGSVNIQDMPAVEFERHVIKPVPGRTRTQIQVVTHLNCLPDRFYDFYNDFGLSEPAEPKTIILNDKVVITNPAEGWSEFKTTLAKKLDLTDAEMSFPKGFRKVETVSELTINDNQETLPSEQEMPQTLHPKFENASKRHKP